MNDSTEADIVWHDPAKAVADGFFEIDEQVVALLETGETVDLIYTWLAYEGDPADVWTGFAYPNGEEVLNSDIKSVRARGHALLATDRVASND